MIVDLFNVDTVNHDDVGGKAYNLHRLHHAGMPVPRAVVIKPLSADLSDRSRLTGHLANTGILKDGTKYAVRSSGVGEDSLGKSWAGIFDSYLFIESDDVIEHVYRVIDSTSSERYKQYSRESDIEIGAMAVVVQEMIDADYAGVAFTVSPIENDERIALLEVVRGVGESLVSSQKTPATIRINKLTDSIRIQQTGYDGIAEDTLNAIAERIVPYMQKIEEIYNIPMDIEWAIHNDRVYILQARPITTT